MFKSTKLSNNKSTSRLSHPFVNFLYTWCSKNSVFIDHEAIDFRTSKIIGNSNSNNNQNENQQQPDIALYAKRDIEPGEMFAIIPQTATLQTSQLPLFSIDGNPAQDPSILPQAVRSIVRGSEVEHPWWELAVLVCLHKCVPHEILEQECLIRDLKIVDTNNKVKNNNNNIPTNERLAEKPRENLNEKKILTTDFSDYLNFLPASSPQEILLASPLLYKSVPQTVRKDFEFNRSQNEIKSARLIRDIPLFEKLNKKFVSSMMTMSSTNSASTATKPITSRDMLWAYEMVTSRANNFSFVRTSTELRPYGLYPTPILGQQPTLCPIFDMMNHVRETNVLVADTLINNGGKEKEKQNDGEGEGDNGTEESSQPSDGLSMLEMDNFTPSIVVGAMRPIKKGDEIGYSYHATPDIAMSLTRWGFSPNSQGF